MCRCICGTQVLKPSHRLIKGDVKSCGCLKESIINLSGSAFGNLTVLSPKDKNFNWNTSWLCVCSCGKKCSIKTPNLLYGHTKSCGCLKQKEYRTVIDGTIVECLTSKISKNNTSGVKGVYRKANKWVAYITFKHKRYYLGAYDTLYDAKEAREKGEIKYFHPVLNSIRKDTGD